MTINKEVDVLNTIRKLLVVCVGILLVAAPTGGAIAAPIDDPTDSLETVEMIEVPGGVLVGPNKIFVRRAPTDKTLYKCFFAGGVQYETNLSYCRNVSVHMIQEGRVVGRFSTDSNGRVYTGRNPSVGCLVALASGGLKLVAPGGGTVGWVAGSWVLAFLGIAVSCP
ncbi:MULTISPECIES: hypothetical protein [Schaalia]|uniref:hypothetical protein n=1 Tax=Schaalia TaxID=2529408 RepID=UPI002A829BDA|nr:hypothetical protein [Schaalia hyovaginalis]MDY4492432.1 hypothetical protein [Schaalia hyovaginalis]